MKYPTTSQQGRGDFSTPFADMVFGLLFIFFLLTLAMVFQKPDVGAYQEKMDHMLNDLERRNREVADWAKKYESLKEGLEAAEQKHEKDQRRLAALQEQNRELQKQMDTLKAEQIRITDALLEYKRMHQDLLARYENLERTHHQTETRLKEDLSRLAAEHNALKQKYGRLTARQKRFVEENAQLKMEVDIFQRMINSIKAMLKKKGLTVILAEIEKMEEDKRKTEERARSGEDMVFANFRLTVAFYPNGEILDGVLWDGDKKVQNYPFLLEEDVLWLAKKMNDEYAAVSSEYTELEKNQHRPRIFLMVHPNTAYGDLQGFLKKVRKSIVVSLVPWNKDAS